jgi:PAS domain S-box-containing protein
METPPTSTKWKGPKRARPHLLLASVAFAVMLCLTSVAAFYVDQQSKEGASERFQRSALLATSAVEDRLARHIASMTEARLALADLVGGDRLLLEGSVAALNVGQQMPALSEFVVSQRIRPHERSAFEAQWTSEFGPAHPIAWPLPAEDAFIARAVWPSALSRDVLGHDLGADPARMSAVREARDTGRTVSSSPRALPMAAGSGEGMHIMVPIYELGRPLATPAQRQEALSGVLTGYLLPTRLASAAQALAGPQVDLVMRDQDANALSALDWTSDPGLVLFDSRWVTQAASSGTPLLKTTTRVEAAGRLWTIEFAAASSFMSPLEKSIGWIILAVGAGLSLLIGGVFYSFSSSEEHGIQLAQRMTEDIRSREERYRELIETAAAGVLTFDGSGALVNANHGAELIFGAPSGGLRGRHLFDVFPRHEGGLPIAEALDIVRKGKGHTRMGGILHEIRRGDGEVRHVESSISTWEARGSSYLTVIVTDVTQRHRIEMELERRTRELHRSNEELKAFASVASHDLKEPLRAVIGFLNIARSRGADAQTDESLAALEHAQRVALRMRGIVDDLLRLSLLEKEPPALRMVDLGAIVSGALENLSARVRETNPMIHISPLPACAGDASQLSILFQNLLANALKFRRQGPVEVRITGRRLGSRVIVSVADNGPGIAADQHEAIFTIFRRGQGSEGVPGSGIGLALCRKIAQRHGGSIWVESVPGEGSTFQVELPATLLEPLGQAHVTHESSNL